MIRNITEDLIVKVQDAATSQTEIEAATDAFFAATSRASLDDTNVALRMLSENIGGADLSRAGLIALVCGALVQLGGDPLIPAGPLTMRLHSLLDNAVALAQACLQRIPKTDDDDRYVAAEFEKVRVDLAAEMPKQCATWEALRQFWPPAIAVFSASAETRQGARGLRDLAVRISEYHEAGHWIGLILTVLDNEPILVIEPEQSLGISGRISGVVDNFQLHTLLMDVLPKTGLLSRRRVSRSAAGVARGKGPQQTDEIVVGAWNPYTWQAIQPDLTLPDPNDFAASKHWIWNEGMPADIPLFEEKRAILLGSPAYPRTWRSQRMFKDLPADLAIEHRLTKTEVTEYLQRMLTAKDDQIAESKS